MVAESRPLIRAAAAVAAVRTLRDRLVPVLHLVVVPVEPLVRADAQAAAGGPLLVCAAAAPEAVVALVMAEPVARGRAGGDADFGASGADGGGG